MSDLDRAYVLLQELKRREAYRFARFFPDCQPGCKPDSLSKHDHVPAAWLEKPVPICRVLYVKHLQFMDAGGIVDEDGDFRFRERLFLAANRIGKTEAAAFEVVCHLTGLYPHWWTGRRFTKAIRMWAAGDTMQSTRDILQVSMLGPVKTVTDKQWDGMIPAHLIKDVTRRSGGVDDCIETVQVLHHPSGDLSSLQFKSFDQGRRLFQGTEQEVIWLDEEPPDDVYAECLTRTLTTRGVVITTLTPLQGLTEFLKQYLETSVMLDTAGAYRASNHVFWPEKVA